MKRIGAAGALFGLPILAPRGLAQDADPDSNAQDGDRRFEGKHARKTQRTLFFNLSHLRGAIATHYLYMGGRKYQLTPTQQEPQVLDDERRSNAFLSAVPDDQITHHVTGVEVSNAGITLAYWTSNENTATGTWEMTGMHFNFPLLPLGFAYRRARRLTPTGPLPLSNKRKMYGAPAANSLKDLRDESVLIDMNSFAEAVVGVHPDILSVEPTAAATIQVNYVSLDSNTQFLAGLLATMGPAVPEGATNISGTLPWATLKPLINDKTGKPYKKSDNLLDQYYPDWNPQVDQSMAPAVQSIHPLVRDDPVLGIDVTSYNLNDPNDRPLNSQLVGTIWARHDGMPTVEQRLGAGAGPSLVFTNRNTETGLAVTTPDLSAAPGGRIAVTLDEVSNWFLRWLGVWVQFLDQNGNVIPLIKLPTDTYPAEPGPYPRSQDLSDTLFLGVQPPALAIMGIPVQPGRFAPVIYMPKSAASMRIFYSGEGLSGDPPQTPTDIYNHGALMTMAFNYSMVCLFMAVGGTTYGFIVKKVVAIGGGAVGAAIAALVGGIENQTSFAKGLGSFAMNFMKVLFNAGAGTVLVELIPLIVAEIGFDEAIDSIPIAGQIARAVAAVVGVLQLAQTIVEIAISPPAYIFDLVATHNLSVTFIPDGSFPVVPAGYSMYYKVSYLFDNGTAHTQSNVPLDPTAKSIPITFTSIPYGGLVNISIGLYMKRNSTPAGQNDWCAGKATTGLVANTVDHVPPPSGSAGFPVTQIRVPIQATTRYIHTRKIALDAQGNHLWVADPDGTHAPPYVPPPGGQTPGLGALDSITVRQSIGANAGYVGYSWKAFSTAIDGCGGSAPGQFDQLANLNTDAGNNGANAQNGYVNSLGLCGYQPGVRMGYNLLTHKSLNIYLDTTALMIRPVNLDPPGFAGPASNQSFGLLNMDSTRCLLHPAGHVVSISNAYHKIEVLKLPSAAQADVVAAKFFQARTYSGLGIQPGLIMSPAAATISPDGVILVLEQGNKRIQAFDLGGNAVPYFIHQPLKYFLELPATADNTYLDLAVEFAGYLYVLSADAANNHRLDIYHPAQRGTAPICTTLGVNAAKITVDFWRDLYALNYEVLRLPNGTIPSFTEPSVSLWVPPPPSP